MLGRREERGSDTRVGRWKAWAEAGSRRVSRRARRATWVGSGGLENSWLLFFGPFSCAVFEGPVQKDVLEGRFRTVFRVRNFGGVFRELVSGTDFRSAFSNARFRKRFTGACFHGAD